MLPASAVERDGASTCTCSCVSSSRTVCALMEAYVWTDNLFLCSERAPCMLLIELLIELPQPPLETEGFLREGDGSVLRVPRPSLTEALEELSGQWLEPDWLMELWTGPWRHPGTALDYEALAARPRRADPPASVAELRAALLDELEPPKLYRARWLARTPPEGPPLAWSAPPQR